MAAKKKTADTKSEEDVLDLSDSKTTSDPRKRFTVEEVDTEQSKADTSVATETEPEKSSSQTVSSFSLLDADKETQSTDTENSPATSEVTDEQQVPEAVETEEATQDPKQWLNDITPDTALGRTSGGGRDWGKILLVILLLLVVGGAVAGGLYYYSKGQENAAQEQTSQSPLQEPQVVSPTESPTPTVAEVDYSELTVQVLNGSGKPGEAGVIETLIEDLSFDSITTGNASSYDFEETEIALKANVPSKVFDDIKELLSEDYTVIKVEEALDESNDYDIQITVGSMGASEEEGE